MTFLILMLDFFVRLIETYIGAVQRTKLLHFDSTSDFFLPLLHVFFFVALSLPYTRQP